jgi:hypothetical protein
MPVLRRNQIQGLVRRQPSYPRSSTSATWARKPSLLDESSAARRASQAPPAEKSVRTTRASKVQGNCFMRGQYRKAGEPLRSQY